MMSRTGHAVPHPRLAALAALALGVAALAAGTWARADAAHEKAHLRLVADRTAYAPGDRARVAAVIHIDDGWHVNSHRPTFDYLIPTTVKLDLPPGFEPAGLAYPTGRMKTFAFSGGHALSVYESEAAIVATFRVPSGQARGKVPLAATLRYQACSDRLCLPPVTTKASLTLRVGAGGVPTHEPPFGAGHSGLAVMLALALLGGLILNAMPCVLPVVSLKVVALLEGAQHGRAALVTGALETAAGILLSYLVLALAAVLARGAGLAVGWGVQFQQPLFVAALAVIITLFCLNLWGLFEINLPRPLADLAAWSPHGGVGSHLVTGFFATLMATPCSAPFLGTAVGFALTRPPGVVFAIFAALGTGMALPYLLLAATPGAARLVPRPGAWMAHLRIGLGFALAAAVVWLLYVLNAEIGPTRVAFVEVTLLGLAACVWIRHVARRPWLRHAARAGALATALLAVGLAIGGQAPARRPLAPAATSARIDWQPFDRARAERLALSGVPVFVDVTADWCFTCKVNEALVLNTDEVAGAFARHGVVAMRADWTNHDAAIGRFLAEHGRYGLPFYLLFQPGGDAHLFGELITRQEIVDAVDRATRGPLASR